MMTSADGYVETLWAQRVVEGENRFRLDNAPFFEYRVSADDIVEGVSISDGMYDFVRVVERSGNRTVRVMFQDDTLGTPFGHRVLDQIKAMGCTYEGMFKKVLAVTVPPEVSLDDVASYLTSTELRWEYADPTYEDLFSPETG